MGYRQLFGFGSAESLEASVHLATKDLMIELVSSLGHTPTYIPLTYSLYLRARPNLSYDRSYILLRVRKLVRPN
jgi:hypothetical protein